MEVTGLGAWEWQEGDHRVGQRARSTREEERTCGAGAAGRTPPVVS